MAVSNIQYCFFMNGSVSLDKIFLKARKQRRNLNNCIIYRDKKGRGKHAVHISFSTYLLTRSIKEPRLSDPITLEKLPGIPEQKIIIGETPNNINVKEANRSFRVMLDHVKSLYFNPVEKNTSKDAFRNMSKVIIFMKLLDILDNIHESNFDEVNDKVFIPKVVVYKNNKQLVFSSIGGIYLKKMFKQILYPQHDPEYTSMNDDISSYTDSHFDLPFVFRTSSNIESEGKAVDFNLYAINKIAKYQLDIRTFDDNDEHKYFISTLERETKVNSNVLEYYNKAVEVLTEKLYKVLN